MLKQFISLAALVVASSSSFAQTAQEASSPALKVGMPAPALTVEKWVKGSPVASFEKGKLYVVEFWATWCGPCVASMPHLSKLQKEYKDKITIIGVTSADDRNTLAKVEKMVADKGDGMGYTVAWDTERKTNTAFMDAAAQDGIPCSFVVDKNGQLAYIGHPLFLDEPLGKLVDGSWNTATDAPALEKAQEQYWGFGQKAQEDPKGALADIADFATKHPKLAALLEEPSVQVAKFTAYMAMDDAASAAPIGNKLVDKAIADKQAGILNMVAWTIVDPDSKMKSRDVELALKAALKADEFTSSKNPAIIDTLARCYATKGDLAKAIELQTKAVGLVDEHNKDSYQKTLDEYKAKMAQ